MSQIVLDSEWLETNNLGGYASTALSGCNTRKYHGLLVSRLSAPRGKFVLLSKLDDSMVHGGEEHFLTAHRFAGGVNSKSEAPRGFELRTHPVINYKIGMLSVTKEILMVQGEDTVLIKYACAKCKGDALLRVKPLIAYRNFHGLTRENIALRVRTFPVRQGFVMSPYDGMPQFHMQAEGPFEFFPAPVWYRGFEYAEEQRRGFDAWEDLFCPGVFEIPMDKGKSVILSASIEAKDDLEAAWETELAARESLRKKQRGTPLKKALARPAGQFLAEHGGKRTVIAGFPWFLEWGRDAMISLPGLLLDREEPSAYLEVLSSFAENRRRGIVPNFLGDTPGENAYNSADAALWLAWAVQKFLEKYPRRASDVPREVALALAETLSFYRQGTDHGIAMRKDGLLAVGSPSEQVTWMDANIDGRPVTPRWGCPVEINALWYNFLCFVMERGEELGLESVTEKTVFTVRSSFNRAFWLEDRGYLADVVRGGEVDASLRPNQIFAVSMPFSALDEARSRSVVDAVRAELLTPFGLRTLARNDHRYKPRYDGGPAERDAAYHNGTVWPFLLGHYGEALLKVEENTSKALEEIERCLIAIEGHLEEAGVGTISEIFDGDAPHAPRGCISQAWSVAEIIRLCSLVEDKRKQLSKERSKCVS